MAAIETVDKMIIITFESGPMKNNTYLIACERTREAMVIDPAGDMEVLLETAKEQNLDIKIILNTHAHYDHTEGNKQLKAITDAEILMHALAAEAIGEADRTLADMDILTVGDIAFDIIHTPGHTAGSICLFAKGQLFSGDTLFVGDSGRTDLPGGDRPTLGASIRRLMHLPADTILRPGHNIGPTPTSTLDWEKRHNVNAREYGYYSG